MTARLTYDPDEQHATHWLNTKTGELFERDHPDDTGDHAAWRKVERPTSEAPDWPTLAEVCRCIDKIRIEPRFADRGDVLRAMWRLRMELGVDIVVEMNQTRVEMCDA